jgi:hypothetical protein
MNESMKFPFSKFHSLFAFVVISTLIITPIPNMIYFYDLHQLIDVLLISLFDLSLLIIFFYALIKFIIPTLKSEIALEINKTGIYSKVNKINVTWDKVDDLGFFTGRYSDFIAIYLKDKKGYTSQIKNPFKRFLMLSSNLLYSTPLILQTVSIKGKDKEIFQIAKQYLDYYKYGKDV